MIPTDLAARLRILTESLVNPVSPVHEISADLPELPVGQRFAARIESALPDGTFRALVAGRSLTLALPQSAKPGDTLELVVTARTPRLILAEGADAAFAEHTASPTLSRAGQLISTLLAGEERAPQPATIARAAPLLPEPPLQAARLVPALQQAIVESGLFYEAHQAQWIAGHYPAAALAREPQSRHAVAPRASNAATPPAAEAATAVETLPDAAAASGRASAPGAPVLPAELQLLVQQQLDAAATQHIIWRGDIWPGQGLKWEIAAEERQRDETGEAPAEQWATKLGLTLPRLGEVNVALTLTQGKVSLAITATADSADTLRQGLGDLADAFAAAGLPPLAAGVDAHEAA
ncbi:MAG: flagellar hook-length control protein FliK [Rhodocyclaceae bacterium]|nr:flagellar hook-length control protein FliK [Rhodocyclaceae bacterium]